MNKTNYQEEYCRMKGKKKKRGSGGGDRGSFALIPCKYNEDIQPVGGRVQSKIRDEVIQKREEEKYASLNKGPYPVAKQDPESKSIYIDDYYCEKVKDLERDENIIIQSKCKGFDKKDDKSTESQTYKSNVYSHTVPYYAMTVPRELDKFRYIHGYH